MAEKTESVNELGLYLHDGMVFRTSGDGLDEDQDEMELLEIINWLLGQKTEAERAATAAQKEKDASVRPATVEQLRSIEFAAYTRYGKTCPACRGHQTEDYGYVERGPDEGHEKDCWLKAAIRASE